MLFTFNILPERMSKKLDSCRRHDELNEFFNLTITESLNAVEKQEGPNDTKTIEMARIISPPSNTQLKKMEIRLKENEETR